MEENSQTQENEKQEEKQEETPEGSSKKYIIIGIIVVAIVLLLGFFLLYRSGNKTAESVVRPIINVIQPQKPTSTPTPSPTPGQVKASVNGTVALRGPIPSGSRLAIGVKSQTNPTYQPLIEELEIVDGVVWEWKGAVRGNNYNIQAFLVDKNENLITQSQVENVTAPVSGVTLEINYSSDLTPPPANSLKIDCNSKNTNGVWRVNFTYNINNPTSSALQYRLGIGTSRSGDLLLDEMVRPKSPDVTQTFTTDYIINPGQTYYAAYAYAECADCDEFSPVSEWEQFTCSDSDIPTATPTATLKPTATPSEE
ncbi:hypothetical protein ACFL2C_03740 [Patescibacteria group bacterium]